MDTRDIEKEQELLLHPSSAPAPAEKKPRKLRLFLSLFALLLLLQTLLSRPQLYLYRYFAPDVRGEGIGSVIAWFACPDVTELQCAFLTVPLDYLDPIDEYGGTVFTNPGGPGRNGTAYLIERGPAPNKILGGRYNILSWDPREVNMTTAPLGCFPTDCAEFLQDFKQMRLGLPMSPHHSSFDAAHAGADEWFLRTEAYYPATITSCGKNGNQKMLSAVSTPYVARDIVSILSALGEKDRGLQYWGFSYGTILSTTFAAIFPELVHRLVLDGVSDSRSYGNDMCLWGKSGMNDTHLVYEGFLHECALAGPGKCVLAGKGKLLEEIGREIFDLEATLLEKPLPMLFTGLNSGILAAPDVRFAIFAALYKPMLWPGLASALSAAIAGDCSALLYLTGFTSKEDMSWRDPLDNVFHRHMTRALSKPVAQSAIMCSDTDRTTLLPPGSAVPDTGFFRTWSEELAQESVTGENWARWIGRCRWWNVTAGEVYRGPWTREEGLRKTKRVIISFSLSPLFRSPYSRTDWVWYSGSPSSSSDRILPQA
ncbi:hypothetical protein CALVIDRAFT_531710 [Calocera viscosa TUFC12733]|uniref:Uncharacterized protein n=1 Tax=Calocera viscosa (strain TUFC12733) TaxID=1330018 RepID=A0A167FZL1_CALVF|nr:hypothetical protein CALVIDRAFT_531710 [Calocera viscosa TUFC12733]